MPGRPPPKPPCGAGIRSSPSAVVTSTPFASTPVTLVPMRSSTPIFSRDRVAFPDNLSPNVASGSSPPSRRSTRTEEASKLRNSSRRLRVASSRICPAISTPVGPAPTITMVSHSRSLGGRCGLRHLECSEDAPAQLERVVDRLHARRVQRELVVPEVRLVGAGRDDQAVVGISIGSSGAGRVHHLPVEIEAGHLGELHLHVLCLPQDVAQRRRDLAGRQDAGGHLVEERLEQMVVAPVDQRDLDVLDRAEQTARRQTAESTAHDTTTTRAAVTDASASCILPLRFDGDQPCGVDQREVRERLREVPEVRAALWRRSPRRRAAAARRTRAASGTGRGPGRSHRSSPARTPARTSRW